MTAQELPVWLLCESGTLGAGGSCLHGPRASLCCAALAVLCALHGTDLDLRSPRTLHCKENRDRQKVILLPAA